MSEWIWCCTLVLGCLIAQSVGWLACWVRHWCSLFCIVFLFAVVVVVVVVVVAWLLPSIWTETIQRSHSTRFRSSCVQWWAWLRLRSFFCWCSISSERGKQHLTKLILLYNTTDSSESNKLAIHINFFPDPFLKQLLEKDPQKRLTIPAIKSHPFFAQIDWGLLEIGYLDPPFLPSVIDWLHCFVSCLMYRIFHG